MAPRTTSTPRRIAYLSLHGTGEGQTGWADVDEVIKGLREAGWSVDFRQPPYVGRTPPGGVARFFVLMAMQLRLAPKLPSFDALYVRSHTMALPISLLARIMGVPVIQECNGPYDDIFLAWPQLRPLRRPIVWATCVQYRWADQIITVTDQLAQWLRDESGHDRVTTIPNGADTELFSPDARSDISPDGPYAVFFGSLAPWQGIASMLRATRSAEWPDGVSLVIAGDGALRADVEKAALDGRVIFLGGRPQDELPGLVAGAVASLIVKDDQAHAASGLSPLKLYESMAAGVPVIASDLPGLNDTVARFGCGIVVPPADADAIARAVAQLTADAPMRAHMGAAGREAALAEYSWQAVVDRTAAVIQTAIRRREQRRTGA